MRFFSKNLLFKLLSVVIGFVISIILAEIFAMIWINFELKKSDNLTYTKLKIIDRNNQRWETHPYLNYIPRPGFQVKDSVTNKIIDSHNSLGFRGPEFSLNKPAGVFRIVMLGGSAVYTSRVQSNFDSIPARLELSLKNRGFNKIEVINGGVSGYSTAEALINLQFRVLELSPDMVIVYEAVNDLHNRYVPAELHHADNRGRLKRWQGEYFPFWAQSYLGRLIALRKGYLNKYLFLDNYIAAPTYLGHTASDSATTGVNYKELLKKNRPNFFRDNLLSIYGICKVRGISFVLSTYGFTLKQQELGYLKTKEYQSGLLEMNQVIRDLAKTNSIPIFDYAEKMSDESEFWRDEIHVSKIGASLTGEMFAKFLIRNNLVHE